MTPILFLMGRHGQTLLNESGLYRGWSNGPDAQLDTTGIAQAREQGVFLSKLDLKIGHIICSDLGRTQETSSIIAEILGIPVTEIIVDARLRPLDVGDFAGTKKEDNLIDPYLADPNKKFPNGESVNEYESRQTEVANELIELLQAGTLQYASTLIIAHVSNIMYWVNLQDGAENYLSERTDIIGPGGLVLVTDDDVIPILNRNINDKLPMKDGTPMTGFVTERENRPPRECWNCRYFKREPDGTGSCGHPVVDIDPDLPDASERKLPDGRVKVGDRDCCDNFRNLPNT